MSTNPAAAAVTAKGKLNVYICSFLLFTVLFLFISAKYVSEFWNCMLMCFYLPNSVPYKTFTIWRLTLNRLKNKMSNCPVGLIRFYQTLIGTFVVIPSIVCFRKRYIYTCQLIKVVKYKTHNLTCHKHKKQKVVKWSVANHKQDNTDQRPRCVGLLLRVLR